LKGWQLLSELGGATWSEARAWKKEEREG
jgi:hypothetical protein